MELKHKSTPVGQSVGHGSNRTFMELKRGFHCPAQAEVEVF